MCALTCFDDALTEMTREEEEKNRSLAPRSVSLPYVWLNTDIYEKRTEEQKKKGTVLFFLLLP
jgi:hypothetical protein